jgi:hypothetical protein
MRKISLWAKHHPLPAIASIIAIKILLAAIAFYIGSALRTMNIYIPFIVCIMALIILVAAAFLYPRRHLTGLSKKQYYVRQKSCDFVIATCSFLMIGTLVNTNFPIHGATISFASSGIISTPPSAEEILSSLQYRDKNSLTKQEKRILKQEFKKQVKVYGKTTLSGNKKGAEKALLIILTIIVAVGLFYLLAALACSISCSGAEGAAIAVFLIGLAGLIWGTIAIIKRIAKGPKKKKDNPTEAGKSM